VGLLLPSCADRRKAIKNNEKTTLPEQAGIGFKSMNYLHHLKLNQADIKIAVLIKKSNIV